MPAYFGIDFGSTSIKLAAVDLQGTKSFGLSAIGIAANSAGSLDFTDSQVTAKLASSVKQLLSETKVREKRVVVSVPESQVYSRIVSLPSMSEAELASAIQWEAEQFVPIPVAEVEIDYSVVRNPPKGSTEKKMLVYLVAAPKKQLQALVDFLLSLGLDPIAVESEMVAISRSLSFAPLPGSTLIVQMGAMSSVLAIVDESSLLFSYVTNVGGVALSRALSQNLTLPLPQAEEYKRTYGLDPKQLEGKVRNGLLLPLEQVISEIRKAMEFYATEHKSRISRILLSGGGAYLPELAPHLGSVFSGVEVVIADPFAAAKAERGVVIPKERAVYSVAVGLAMRVF